MRREGTNFEPVRSSNRKLTMKSTNANRISRLCCCWGSWEIWEGRVKMDGKDYAERKHLSGSELPLDCELLIRLVSQPRLSSTAEQANCFPGGGKQTQSASATGVLKESPRRRGATRRQCRRAQALWQRPAAAVWAGLTGRQLSSSSWRRSKWPAGRASGRQDTQVAGRHAGGGKTRRRRAEARRSRQEAQVAAAEAGRKRTKQKIQYESELGTLANPKSRETDAAFQDLEQPAGPAQTEQRDELVTELSDETIKTLPRPVTAACSLTLYRSDISADEEQRLQQDH
uniref:Uncharacterized protein n=1 Tax=Macrostomum lignano TaxID=282301 RepID=A0A1I8IXB6_9PLAT